MKGEAWRVGTGKDSDEAHLLIDFDVDDRMLDVQSLHSCLL